MSQFRPIKGLDEIIQAQEYVEGHLYFATDSGKIYLDSQGERVPMSGGISILYAKAEKVIERPDDTYEMKISDLDDENAFPKMDDLIINKDGRFFKVMTANHSLDELICELIAVSGTGGGGTGGGPGGDAPSKESISLSLIDSSVPMSFIVGKSHIINLKAVASADTSVTFTCKVIYADNTYAVKTETWFNDTIYQFDIGSMLKEGTNKITLRVQGENSGWTEKNYSNRKGVVMELRPSTDFYPLKINTGAINFACIPVGDGLSKTLKVVVDDAQTYLVENITSSEQKVTVPLPAMPHGKHTIVATLSSDGIETNPLTYEVMWVKDGDTTPIIILGDYPTQITNYQDLKIQYMVYDPSAPAAAEVHFYLNQQELLTSPLTKTYNENIYHEWNITNYTVGLNNISIGCGNAPLRTISVLVEEDVSRDLNIIDGVDLYLNLDATGRSNEENKTSRGIWSYTNDNNITTTAQLNNFNWYNNGWILDKDGNTCLRISNGAELRIPLDLMRTQKLNTGLTFEFQMRLRNVKNYSTLITTTTEVVEEEDGSERVIITKTVNTEEGVCGSYYANGIGMCIGTQEAFFKSNNTAGAVSARYKDDELMNLTFVIEKKGNQTYDPLMYIYINGIASGILEYTDSESFASNAKELIFNSTYCDVDLYKIRVYTAPLSSVDVVHNFIADKKQVELYDVNKIIKYNNGIPNIDYGLLREYNLAHPDKPTMPVAIIQMLDDDNGGERLPYVKEAKRKCNIEFINYSLDYAYNNKLVSDIQYVSGCPSFYAENVEGDVQGTSSQGYPRRNFKFKFKKADSWKYTNGPLNGKEINSENTVNDRTFKGYYMDNQDASETTFTWKADYMESSGTHNTGFASFVKELYGKGDDTFNVHPLQDYVEEYADERNMPNYRTTIYGFPMLVFQKFKDNHYEYVGKYNFNLDKGCDNVCGFTDSHLSKIKDNEGKYVPLEKVAECWEFCNNQGTRCSFTKVDFEETDKDGKLTVLNDFEVRYHADADEIEEAIKVNNNTYILDKYENLQKLASWLYSVHPHRATNEPLRAPVTYEGIVHTADTMAYRLGKFKNEFNEHFDFQYCAIYYILTELIIGYDSRGKNMMLASWGPQVDGGEYIWYPIFYDIDTQLGVNNSGVPSWDYFEEPSRDGTFSTSDSALWVNFGQAFATRIEEVYHKLRTAQNGLTFTTLNGYYAADPKVSGSYAMEGLRPQNAYNIDEYYKYISPSRDGYTATDGILNGTNDAGRHYYCLQGTRELQRELFLRNRFNYVDSKWQANSYHGTTETKIRYNANYKDKTSDKFVTTNPPPAGYEYSAYPHMLDANADFTITPYLKQYAYAKFDTSRIGTELPYFDGTNPVISRPAVDVQTSIEQSAPFTQQLVYFGGVEYISSFGDLSRKYMDELSCNKAIRLKDFILGSDDSNYYNNGIDQSSFSFVSNVNDSTAKPLLEQVILTNVPSMVGTLILTGSEKLQEFRALNTNLSSVEFAKGVQLTKAHLPKSITNLKLTEPVALTKLLNKTQIEEMYNTKVFTNGLYLEDLLEQPNNLNARTHLTNIEISGGVLGYNTYKLAKKVTDIKLQMQQVDSQTLFTEGYSSILYIDLYNVQWSPYRLVKAGETKINSSIYKIKTDHYTFREMTEEDAWELNVLNGVVYEYNELDFAENKNTITDLSLLDTYIEQIKETDTNEPIYFISNDETGGKRKIPQITGTMFINNTVPIDEVTLKNYYMDQFFPKLDIQVASVIEAATIKFVEIINEETGQQKVLDLRKYENTLEAPNDISTWIVPSKSYYVFEGWSHTPNGDIIDLSNYTNELSFNSNKSYVLYAKYRKEEKIITFRNFDGTELLTTKGVFDETLVSPTYLIPYRDDMDLTPITKTWVFKGWTTDPTKTELTPTIKPEDVLVNLNTLYGDREWNFYAVFAQDDVYNNVMDIKYFELEPLNGFSDPNDTSFNITGKAWSLKLKEDYKNVIKGKLTLPCINPNTNEPIIAISVLSFANNNNITHIFFDKAYSDNIRTFGERAFRDCNNLRYIEFPKKLRTIYNQCFRGCTKLSTHQNYQLLTGTGYLEIGNNIRYIGEQAFNGASSDFNTIKIFIGSNITKIASQAFNYIDTRKDTIEMGTAEHPLTTLTIDGHFINVSNDDYKATTLTIYYNSSLEVTLDAYESYFAAGAITITKIPVS